MVRRIYQLIIEGNGTMQVARIIKDEKAERPSYYLAKQGLGTCRGSCDMNRPYTWTASTISDLVRKPEYMGHTVNFHPKKGDINPLTGLMYCADCGAKMFNHRIGGYEKKDKDGNPIGKYTNAQDNYTCSTYSKAKSKFENKCTQHHVRTDVIRDLLLEIIKATSTYVLEHEAEFIEKVHNATELQQENEAKALKKRLSREQKRINELNILIKKIYEDNVNGKLSDKRFEMLLTDYETEQNEWELSVDTLEKTLNDYQENADNVDKFIELVHEADKSTGDRIQQIDIYLKYVEKLDVPMPELTPEQLKEEERKHLKRAWNRTYMRRRYEREKAEREVKEKGGI